jgi:hypothetical protein
MPLGPSALTVQPSATTYSLFGYGGPCFVLLTADPTQGNGEDAPLASIGFLQLPGTGTASLYFKTGTGTTNWTQVSVP